MTDSWWEAFVAGLQEHGWIESQNIVIERRYAELRKERALAAAEELVRLRVEVIVVASTQAALAAKQATSTLPIVMTGEYVTISFLEHSALIGAFSLDGFFFVVEGLKDSGLAKK